jgi:hypothetical protein
VAGRALLPPARRDPGQLQADLSLGSDVLSIDHASSPEAEVETLAILASEVERAVTTGQPGALTLLLSLAGPGTGEAELVFPAGPAVPALLRGSAACSTSARPVGRARTPGKVSASRRPLAAGGPRPSMAGESPRGPGCRRPGWWRLTLRTGRTLL